MISGPVVLLPFSRNLLIGAAATANAYPAWPAANVVNSSELRRPWMQHGPWIVVAGLYDQIRFAEGGPVLTATIAPGTYDAAALGLAAKTAMDAAGALTYTVIWRQDAAARFRFEISATGAFTMLEPTSYPRSAPRYLLGYGNYARVAAATQTADVPMIHGYATTGATGGAIVEWDLGSAQTVEAVAVIGADAQCGLVARWHFGAAPATATAEDTMGGYYDDEVMAHVLATPRTYRYLALHMVDPHRETYPWMGAQYVYAGPMFQPEGNWDAVGGRVDGAGAVYSERQLMPGQSFLSESVPGDSLRLTFASSAATPRDAARWVEALTTLGRGGLAVVVTHPGEDEQEARLVRVVGAPTLQQGERPSLPSRYEISLDMAVETTEKPTEVW